MGSGNRVFQGMRPNKPVLPAATNSLNHYASGPLRRQTGQPLGSQE